MSEIQIKRETQSNIQKVRKERAAVSSVKICIESLHNHVGIELLQAEIDAPGGARDDNSSKLGFLVSSLVQREKPTEPERRRNSTVTPACLLPAPPRTPALTKEGFRLKGSVGPRTAQSLEPDE